jgi:predicted nucleotidyltransferase
MNEAGLPRGVAHQLASVLCHYPDVQQLVLFGSRAKGTAHPASDIDLAVWGIEDVLRLEALAVELDELPLPFKFDVKSYSSISNPSLRTHIDRAGCLLYRAGVTECDRNPAL